MISKYSAFALVAPVVSLLAVAGYRTSAQDTNAAQERGLLDRANALDTGMGAELYVYVTTPTKGFEDVVKVLPDHMDFVHEIERQGAMVMGGQTTLMGEADANGNGMIVLRANSFEEARRIADRDPMHKTGVRKYDLYRWQINEGTVMLRLQFSDQKFEIR